MLTDQEKKKLREISIDRRYCGRQSPSFVVAISAEVGSRYHQR